MDETPLPWPCPTKGVSIPGAQELTPTRPPPSPDRQDSAQSGKLKEVLPNLSINMHTLSARDKGPRPPPGSPRWGGGRQPPGTGGSWVHLQISMPSAPMDLQAAGVDATQRPSPSRAPPTPSQISRRDPLPSLPRPLIQPSAPEGLMGAAGTRVRLAGHCRWGESVGLPGPPCSGSWGPGGLASETPLQILQAWGGRVQGGVCAREALPGISSGAAQTARNRGHIQGISSSGDQLGRGAK